ncbi:hypothetical protein LCGC14_1335740 [marine sediment metagenome]|uniref:Phosphoadenosine phosphosulphate reductase domain-containing protein n=1 Tax=marine sediment metagenome TaxID=412755 RepID=A0A0F9KFY9_9ZZZZ
MSRINWRTFPYQREHATVMSFGAGVQTTALAILAVQGKLDPRPDFAVFADTGGERPETYEHIYRFSEWLAERGLPLHIARQRIMPLEEWVLTRSPSIPVFMTPNARGRRQCTVEWKIRPIYYYIRYKLAIRTFDMQIGISSDEIMRMKPARPKYVTNSWPLVDMGLSRTDCFDIIRKAGIKSAGKSACFFCPYQDGKRWVDTRRRYPDLWARAIAMEDTINKRFAEKGDSRQAFLTKLRVPLRMLGEEIPIEDLEGEECEGYCFV